MSSGRYETLSRRAGIDRTMRFHQLAARAVLVLALLHVLFFLVPSRAASWRAIAPEPTGQPVGGIATRREDDRHACT